MGFLFYGGFGTLASPLVLKTSTRQRWRVVSSTLTSTATVSWESGLIHRFAKPAHLKECRGFESLTHRQVSSYYRVMANTTNRRRADQLGMAWGTAAHRLRRRLFHGLLVKLGANICHKCSLPIDSPEELSIEHMKDWLDVDPALFWDESNIAYSHRKCNRPSRFNQPTGKHGTQGMYVGGCRCEACSKAHNKSTNEWRYRKGLRRNGGLGTLASPAVSKTVTVVNPSVGSSTLPPTAKD